MRLKQLYEDKNITTGGSKAFSAETEKEVYPKHTKSAAGPGIKPPPKGDISQITDVGSPAYTTDTLVPSRLYTKQKPKVGKINV